MIYDIFYVSRGTINPNSWTQFKDRFPSSQKIENVKNVNDIKSKSFTKFFWVVWNDIIVNESFSFDYRVPSWDEKYIHVFKNGKSYDGISLIPKSSDISSKEFNNRFFVNKKEINIVASYPKPYDVFYITSYDEYITAIETSKTDIFWAVWNDVIVSPDFKFDYQVPRYEQHIPHIFKNGEHFDGICIFSKEYVLSKKEINSRFFVNNKKEIDINASVPKQYDKFYIENYDDYLEALENTSTEMFWMLSHNLKIDESFKFDFYFSHHNVYDRAQNHAFIHRVDNTDLYNGVFLCSVNQKLSKKEIDYRFPIERKEWPIVASGPILYKQYCLKDYKDYLEKLETASTELFWNIPKDIIVEKDFKFDLYFRHDNEYDRKINHVFKNAEFYDGIALFSKHKPITEREFKNRFLIDKKEWDVVASTPVNYDIVFISYNESNADKNYEHLLNRYPTAQRVDKVKGIHQAHIEAAKLASTPLFWVVDGDAEIVDTFNFSIDYVPHYDVGNREILEKTVHVWRSCNPVNDLTYGYGGVKLLPRQLTIDMDTETSDMTTAISSYFKVMPGISNYTVFNTDPFSAWRSAFRECAKLASKIIDRNYEEETDERLNVWCSSGLEKPFGNYVIAGANAGRIFGETYIGIPEALVRINNFEWLLQEFLKWQESND
jgi:hypothetical protein